MYISHLFQHTFPRISIACAACSLLLLSCEKSETGLIDQNGLPPRVYSATLTPSIVNSDTINVGAERTPDDLLSIPLTVLVRVSGETSGSRLSVPVILFQDPRMPLYDGILHDDGVTPDSVSADSVYSGTIPFSILRSQIGTFYVEMTAVDFYGNESNSIRLPLTIERLNQPPIISALNAPDTVHTSSSQSFLITVKATDPDGLQDIRSITRTTPQGNVFSLNDSGLNGDELASDGTYTETVSLVPAPAPGSYAFTFQAHDRSNAASNIIVHTIVVLQ